jgi:hypothetical protein
MSTNTREPIEIYAGDKIEFTKSYADYPATDWTLAYTLLGTEKYTFSATANAAAFDVAVTSATTNTWSNGQYRIVGAVTNGSNRFTVYSNTLCVLPNPSTVSGSYDARSQNQIILDAIRAKLAGASDVTGINVNGKSISRMSMLELIRAEQIYAQRVQNEKLKAQLDAGYGSGRNIEVRFNQP